jgi:hypothetical protein
MEKAWLSLLGPISTKLILKDTTNNKSRDKIVKLNK